MEIFKPKGTRDVLGLEAGAFESVEGLLKQIAEIYGFSPIRTPIFEHTELFTRSVGDSSDIVRKEMYTFNDKSDRSLTLRPELTAGVIRAIIENKLVSTSDLPIKTYYLGPAFRYERPQLGRFRQFTQFGVETVGVVSPLSDAETILLGFICLKTLGFEKLVVKINSLGDEITRTNYRNALKTFYENKVATLCPDCQNRYNLNPLRLLDCKVKEDQEVAKLAPKIKNYLSPESIQYMDKIVATLKNFDVDFEFDDQLVRGLDYYSHVVFEYHFKNTDGRDYGAIGAGGHYHNLVKELGGESLAGVGFALGLERIIAVMGDEKLLEDNQPFLNFYVMPLAATNLDYAFETATILRSRGHRTEISLDLKPLKTLFKKAERRNAQFAIIIGDDEQKAKSVKLKNLNTQEQEDVLLKDLLKHIEELMSHHCEGGCQCGGDCKEEH